MALTVASVLLLSVLQGALTLLLLNLFLRHVPLPTTGARLRLATRPWLWLSLAAGAGVSVLQGVVGGWLTGLALAPLNLYLTWLLWKFGLRKQFPHERPLG